MGIAATARPAGVAGLAVLLLVAGTAPAAATSRPSAPRSVAAKPGNALVRISWQAPSSTGGAAVDRYAVQRTTSPTGSWATVARTAAGIHAWTNTGLVNGRRYYFRVRAHNAVGWGPASTAVSAVPRTVPSAPRSPAAVPGDSSATVTWTAPSSTGGAPIDKYAVQQFAGTWSTVSTTPATARRATVTGLANGTSYPLRVRAHNVAGWSPASASVSAVPCTVPSAPLSPAVTPGDGSATVSWQPPADSGGAAVDGFRVQYSTDGTTWSNAPAGAAQTELTVTSLQNGVGYHFRVEAHNAAGWSPASSEVQAVPGLPLPPTQLQGQSLSDGADFSWTPSATVSPAVQGYEVEFSTDPSVLWNVQSVSADATHFTVTSSAYGASYYFRARAYNATGYSDWSATTSAVVGLAPGPVGDLSVTYWGSPYFWNAVDWTAPTSGSPVQGYHVERIVTEGPYQFVKNVTDSYWIDQGVSHTTDYWYRITPYNQVGDGPASVVHITTP
jgi:titin